KKKYLFPFFCPIQDCACGPFLPSYHAGNCPIRQGGHPVGFAGLSPVYLSLSGYLFCPTYRLNAPFLSSFCLAFFTSRLIRFRCLFRILPGYGGICCFRVGSKDFL